MEKRKRGSVIQSDLNTSWIIAGVIILFILGFSSWPLILAIVFLFIIPNLKKLGNDTSLNTINTLVIAGLVIMFLFGPSFGLWLLMPLIMFGLITNADWGGFWTKLSIVLMMSSWPIISWTGQGRGPSLTIIFYMLELGLIISLLVGMEILPRGSKRKTEKRKRGADHWLAIPVPDDDPHVAYDPHADADLYDLRATEAQQHAHTQGDAPHGKA